MKKYFSLAALVSALLLMPACGWPRGRSLPCYRGCAAPCSISEPAETVCRPCDSGACPVGCSSVQPAMLPAPQPGFQEQAPAMSYDHANTNIAQETQRYHPSEQSDEQDLDLDAPNMIQPRAQAPSMDYSPDLK